MKTIEIKDLSRIRAITDQFIAEMTAELSARWDAWKIDLMEKERHEVVGALMARQVTLVRFLARSPECWNYDVGPIFLRAMADVFISLAWILEEPDKSLERSQMFIHFGLGQQKLQLEHRRAKIAQEGREPSSVESRGMDAIENWINTQQYTFLTEVNVGSWSGKSTREMATEAHCIDFYNYVYQPWSGVSHSMWQHVGQLNVQQCMNPLHLLHLTPAIHDSPPELQLLLLGGKYMDKVFRLFDRKTGVEVAVDSAFRNLDENLERLAEELDPSGTHPEAEGTGESGGD